MTSKSFRVNLWLLLPILLIGAGIRDGFFVNFFSEIRWTYLVISLILFLNIWVRGLDNIFIHSSMAELCFSVFFLVLIFSNLIMGFSINTFISNVVLVLLFLTAKSFVESRSYNFSLKKIHSTLVYMGVFYIAFCYIFFDNYIVNVGVNIFYGPSGNAHNTGNLLALSVIFVCISFDFKQNYKVFTLFQIILVLLGFYLMIMTHSRSSFLIITIFVFLNIITSKNLLRNIVITGGVMIFFSFCIFFFTLNSEAFSTILEIFVRGVERGLSGRDEIALYMIDMIFKDNATLYFGNGAGSISSLPETLSASDAGSFVVVLFEFGIFGLIFWIFLIFVCILGLMVKNKNYFKNEKSFFIICLSFACNPSDSNLTAYSSINGFLTVFGLFVTGQRLLKNYWKVS